MADFDALPAGPAQDDLYEIYQLRYARNGARTVHENVAWRDMHDGPMPLDYHVWILRNHSRTILVDTGFGARGARKFGRKLDLDPVEALARIGVDPAALEHIVITHLHYDHAGNMEHFPAAKFHVQDAEVEFATGRCMCNPFLRLPFDVEDVVTLIRNTYADRVTFHNGDGAPWPGITLHHLPGHAKGLQSVRVNTARGPVLLASDASHYYANFLNKSAFSLTLDTAETMETYDRLMELGGDVEHVIPGHDPKVRNFFPGIEVAGIELSVLHEAPAAHSIDEYKTYSYDR